MIDRYHLHLMLGKIFRNQTILLKNPKLAQVGVGAFPELARGFLGRWFSGCLVESLRIFERAWKGVVVVVVVFTCGVRFNIVL